MKHDPAAIVGYGFRLPGGLRTPDDFWRLLSQREFIREPIADRYGRGYEPAFGESGPSRLASPYEGLMRGDEPYLFDSRLFGVSTHEASAMDPQLRMLLTCTWEAFEHAGWDHSRLRNSRTGVFIGAQVSSSGNWRPVLGPNQYTITGTSLDMLPNRISYTFSLMGPSAAYLTACSSGATAMHAAVTALASGDCDQAVIGASSHLGSALASVGFAQLGVIDPHGGCRSFDATAHGYMRSEGVFVYLLKPLAAAERDGDRILGIVVGTAVNTAGAADGATGSGPGRTITAPTQHAQVELMRAACARAGLSGDDVDYIEAHATGTRVGDRIEGNAISEVFGGQSRPVAMRVSGVKSNVGHMEAAAFTCALLKVLLMFEHRTYAPISRHFVVPNPDIDFTGLRVQTQTEAFGDRPVVVGINSFGFGGANGHALLAEYRPDRAPTYSEPAAAGAAYLIPLSARSPDALRESALAHRDLLAGTTHFDLYTLAANMSRRRTHFTSRTAFAATDIPHLVAQLDTFVSGSAPIATVAEGVAKPRILMVFAGQGTQWAGCGLDLYASSPVFARAIDAVDTAWRELAGFSLREVCFTEAQTNLDEPRLAQPVIFMIQVALVELLASWGVRADGVVGHSAGEVAAAYAAGMLTLADATRLVFTRATLQQRTAGSGRMLAVDLSRADVEALLRDLPAAGLDVACENSAVSTVVCGTEADLAPLVARLEHDRVQHRLLRGNVAFHSRAMDPIAAPLRQALAFLDGATLPPTVPLISSVTGAVADQLDAAYWWSNVREPVRFRDAMMTAAAQVRPNVVIELAPHPVLLGAVAQCLEEQYRDGRALPVGVATLRRDTDTRIAFHDALAALYCEGVPLDFAAQYPHPRPITHLLPTHPRNDVRVMDPMGDDAHFIKRGEYSTGPLVGRAIPSMQPRFEVRMSAADFSWLTDHRVQHTSIMPAAGYVEMVLEAMGGAPVHFDQVEFLKPCPVGTIPVRLQTELTESASVDAFSFRIFSLPYDDADRVLHCTGRVRRPTTAQPTPGTLAKLDRAGFVNDRLDSREAFYGHLSAVIGDYFQYGPRFQVVTGVQQNLVTQELLLDLRLDDAAWRDSQRAGYLLAPSLLDGGLQAFLYYLMQCSDISAIPRRMHGLTIDRSPSSPHLVCHFVPPALSGLHEQGQLTLPLGERASGSLTMYDAATGERVAHLASYSSFHANPKHEAPGRSRFVLDWQPKFRTDAASLLGSVRSDRFDIHAMIAAIAAGSPDDPGRPCRIAEFSHADAADQLAVADYLRKPSTTDQAELWLVGASAAHSQALVEAFQHSDAAVRFATADLSDPASIDLNRGLLRASACELVIIDPRTTTLTPAVWALLRRLLVPGGIAAIRYPDSGLTPTMPGWTLLTRGTQHALWSAPVQRFDDGADEVVSPRLVIADDGSLGELWAAEVAAGHRITLRSLDDQWLLARETQELLRTQRAIDIFFDDPATEPAAAGADSTDGTDGGRDGDPLGEQLVGRLLALVNALSVARAQRPGTACRLTIITRHAALDVRSPRGATLWGAMRAADHELDPGALLDWRLVDLGDSSDLPTLHWLARHDVREREVAIRAGRLHVPRLVSRPGMYPWVAANADHPYRLRVTSPGQLAGLSMRSEPPEPLGPRQVEIEVAAAALNFRDVMVALDLLPLASYERSALGREVGIEASGTVARIGTSVTEHRVGQRVVFMKGGCIGNRVRVDAAAVFPHPEMLSMAQSAGVLSAYVTAYYALADLARLRAGQRVLIHSAMGGVGQAAIALARHLGATIYATAGTPDKRERLLDLGVEAAFDSHSYSWHDDLLAATNGEGVDVVLNSLAGHHLTLCLQVLRPGGWHCEIGKVDIYADHALGLSIFRKNLRFAAIDIDRLMNDDPAHCRSLTEACLRLIEAGTVPPLPVTTFDYADYEHALRFMTSGQHEGKLVLVAPTASTAPAMHVVDRSLILDPEATYLVTGGLGGLGLRLIAYLVSIGARHLTLMDRDPERQRDAAWVRRASGISHFFPDDDVQLDLVYADVSRRADVDACVAGLARPLKGVFHLAAVLDDRPLAAVCAESIAAVFAPKAGGAWYLHEATINAPLDHFVMLSSVVSVFGNAGQSVYAAANAFLDGLAAYRRVLGLPALAYDLAAVAEVGMASRDTRVLRLMKASGMPAVSVALAIANLDFALRTMRQDAHLIGADFGRLRGTVEHPDYLRIGRWMSNHASVAELGGSGMTRAGIVREIAQKITALSGHEQIGPQEPIAAFGLNSISVTELVVFISSRFQHHVGALELMTTATPESIAAAILRSKTLPPGGEPAPAHPEVDPVSLPAQCQDDLDQLQRTIASLVDRYPVGQPRPADRFEAVLLTGATGFVGRFVLRDLLQQTDHLVVHCLVRADDPVQGLERIRAAMESAEIWDDAYAARLKIWPGDIRRPRLGLPDQDFDRLCDTIDAVYHLAADLNLFSSYARMREANTTSVEGVLELALRRRTKHLVYASTMGVFPQYFCNFAKEFSENRIDEGAQPDLDLMKSIFPPQLVGYPWTKVVVEQSLLFGQTLGLPVAIMRLPQTGIAASTGYTQSSDIKVRIIMAILDVGLMPAGFRLQPTEPVDTVSALLTAISLSDRRRTISHLVNAAPHDHGLDLTDFGLEVRECSYAEFKRACQARASKSPLYGHWGLIDHFADYWFPAASATADRREPLPMGDVTAAVDASLAPAWPGLITTTSRSLGWVTRHQQTWPHHRPRIALDCDALVRRAEQYAKRLDVRFEQAYPHALLDGLDELVRALRAPTAKIREDRVPGIVFEFGRRLWDRAALTSESMRVPQIAHEPIARPVFILGMNRTGTTFLHRLLAQDDRFWVTYPHELAHPALPVGKPDAARRHYADDLIAASGVAEAMRGIHTVDVGAPEEEFALLEGSFASWTYTLRHFVPEYAHWLARQPGGFAYRLHRRVLQHFSWQRGTRLGVATRPWLLKMPFHLAHLQTLMETYPDAVFIQTHRDPQELMPSWLSLAESVRSLTADCPDKRSLGLEQLEFMSHMLTGATRLRAAHPEFEHRFLDVSYLDLVKDPVGTVDEIYRRFDWPLDEQTRRASERWIAEQAALRSTEGTHRYSLQTYGLTPHTVDSAFADYTEFVAQHGVRMLR